MTSKEALKELFNEANRLSSDKQKYTTLELFEFSKIIEKDLELLESIKEVFKKVYHTPEYIYGEEDENGTIPIIYKPKVKVTDEFDKELFRQILEQCGFEIKEAKK